MGNAASSRANTGAKAWGKGGNPHAYGAAGNRSTPSGPDLPRKRVDEEKRRGRVLEWKGKYGWIQPEETVDHPRAGKHQGRIFVSVVDVMGADRLSSGDRVEYILFEDDAGLGAEECVRIESGDGEYSVES